MTSSTATPPALSRVLFVPDDLLSGELRESFFDRQSFLVRTASDAATALSMADIWRPSLVVFASSLSGVRIAEFCTRLRAKKRAAGPRLLMLTEQLGTPIDDAALEICDCHLISPVATSQLLDTIASLLSIATRRAPRAALETLVHTRGFTSAENDADPTLGNCVNVSEEGMLIECNKQLQVNAEGELQFFIPGSDERISVRGVVRMAVDEIRLHYAFEWRDLGAAERLQIRNYIAEASAA